MSHCEHRARGPSAEDEATATFHRVDSRDPAERAEETVRLHTNCHVSRGHDAGREAAAEEEEEEDEDEDGEEEREAPAGGSEKKTLCPAALCVTASDEGRAREERSKTCPGLGLFYALLSTFLFSSITVLVKMIQGLHAIEISAIRCFFQMLFIAPLLIYHKTGFLGPRDKRGYLLLRGFLGSNAMILLFYAVQQMTLADATVIMFSNPVFTTLLAWIFLKEKCTIWDCIFTVFTIAGVILIARPTFLFGDPLGGFETDYTKHVKGAIAAFAGAIAAACTMVILRKLGKSVHYYLSVWYYAVIGLIQCIIVVSVLGEWKLPFCGRDRWLLILIGILGIGGQILLTKALQLEKAGPVSLMRTGDVVLSFIFQFIFFNRAPTLWSLGGALCIVVSSSGTALRQWYVMTRGS